METKSKAVIQKIVSGTFAQSGTGNFNGKNTAGIRLHIPASMMQQLGMTDASKFKPFSAIVVEAEYNELVKASDIEDPTSTYFEQNDALGKTKKDSDGNDIKFKRTEATAVFATHAEADNALNDDAYESALLAQQRADKLAQQAMQSKIALNKLATDNGLTIEAMRALSASL